MRKHLKNYFIPHKENDYKPYSVRRESLLATIIFGLGILGLSFFGGNNLAGNLLLADVQSVLLAQVTNENRIENNKTRLQPNVLLEQAAQLKAQDMIQNEYFAHVSPTGKQAWDWMDDVGYAYKFAGENLAIDFYDTEAVAKAWMESPTHRKNILNEKYTEIGIAVDSGRYKGRDVAFVVQMFGSPRYPTSPTNTLPVLEPEVVEEPEIQIAAIRSSDQELVLGDEIALDPISLETKEIFNDQEVIYNLQQKIAQLQEELTRSTTFVETEYNPNPIVLGDEFIEENNKNTITQSTLEKKDVPYNSLIKTLARPGKIGQFILQLLIGLVSLSLVLKIFIEYKKQHYKNVIFTLLTLVVLLLAYFLISIIFKQVIII